VKVNDSPYTLRQQQKDALIAAPPGGIVYQFEPAGIRGWNTCSVHYVFDVRQYDRSMKKRDSEHQIVASLNDALKARGWLAMALQGLPIAYARESVVTPYFVCSSITTKPYGKYTIDGAVGVIHQRFEAAWMKNPDRKPLQPGFAAVLDILNFPDLRNKRFISPDTSLETDVANFAAAVADILDAMPQDERTLIAAYEAKKLCEFEWNAVSGYSYRTKFQALQEFIDRSAKES
jgi:hypothetical protein